MGDNRSTPLGVAILDELLHGKHLEQCMGQYHIDDDDNDGEDCYWPKYTYLFFFFNLFGHVGSQLQHLGSSSCHVGSSVESHGPSKCGAKALEHVGSIVVAHRLSCPTARGSLTGD